MRGNECLFISTTAGVASQHKSPHFIDTFHSCTSSTTQSENHLPIRSIHLVAYLDYYICQITDRLVQFRIAEQLIESTGIGKKPIPACSTIRERANMINLNTGNS
ncbi:uncharacterized protein LOC134204233 [Armigeres subalbatus]|uniref:uncharacterized protein LOC134204233 n=1 Tax=Armigeres subalbatus TaxID=124917 RepID=UPI002ECFB032